MKETTHKAEEFYTNRCILTLYALSPDENEIPLYMITTCLNIQVTRIKEVIAEYEVLILRQILLTNFITNVWRLVMRICIFISRLKGLKLLLASFVSVV